MHSRCMAFTGNHLTLLFIALLGPNAFVLAVTETVLYRFAHGATGSNPIADAEPRIAKAAKRYSGARIRFSCSQSKLVNSPSQSRIEVKWPLDNAH